jgi:hypothetical protein
VVSGWFALLALKGTPGAIVTRLNGEVVAALADRDAHAKFQLQGAEPVSLSPEQAKKFVSEEIKKYHDIIVKSGMPQIEVTAQQLAQACVDPGARLHRRRRTDRAHGGRQSGARRCAGDRARGRA